MTLEDDAFKIPKSPTQVGRKYAMIVVVVGAVVGSAIAASVGGKDNVERGMSLGFGLVLPAAIAYAIGYFRQKRRLAA